MTIVLNGHRLAAEYTGGTKVDPLSQAIKVAASAWPIVFAAVVAQTLKMYAAHRVERGIKLVVCCKLPKNWPSTNAVIYRLWNS